MAGDGLTGFTPEFAALLRAAGVTLDFASGFNKGLNTKWGTFTEKDLDQNAPYLKLLHSGIKPGYTLNSIDTKQAIEEVVKKKGFITPEVQKLYDSVNKQQAQEIARGAETTTPKKGFFHKTLDIISRPGKAITTGLFESNEERKRKGETGFGQGWDTFDEFFSGAKKGFLGRESKTGSDILKQHGVDNKVGLAVGGFATDVATDPLSYIGLGIGKRALQVGSKAIKTENVAKDFADTIAKGPKVNALNAPLAPDLAKALGIDATKSSKLLTPTAKANILAKGTETIDATSSHLGAQAAKIAQENLATNLVKVGMGANKAKTSAARWLNPRTSNAVLAGSANKIHQAELASRASWLKLMENSPQVSNLVRLDKSRAVIYQEAKDTTAKQMSEILNANLQQQVKRSLMLKGFGLEAKVADIPEAIGKSLDAVAKVNPINTTMKLFNKTFNTGSRFDRALTTTKARAAGKAEQRIGIAQRSLVSAFRGVNKDQRKAWTKAFVGSPGLGKNVLKLHDGTDAADYIHDVMNHLGNYIDWTGNGSGILSLRRINAYLPKEYKLNSFKAVGYGGNNVVNFKKLFLSEKDHFSNIDPQNFLYHMHIATEKAIARDQTMKAIAEFGIPKVANILTHDQATGKLIREGSAAARELVNNHGYAPILGKTTRESFKEVDPSFDRYLKDLVFHPEIKKGLTTFINAIDNYKGTSDLMRFYDKAMGYFKKSVTLPSPTYHIRNSIGDVFTSYLDDVQGLRGAASYTQAAKVMKALNPISKDQQISNILNAAPTASGDLINPMKEIANILSASGKTSLSGRVVMKKSPKWNDVPGSHLSAEQIWAAYNHMGLKRGFVATDLEHELKGNPNLPLQLVHGATQKILDFSQNREDYFRLAHFIDRLKRSKASTFEGAAEEAAQAVKKYHFDYSDVTPTERAVFGRLMPFYKFTRFATPLMLQTFAANPSKILNAQRLLNNISTASGYSNDTGDFLPSADQILPEYFQDLMMLPLFDDNGSTAYFNPGLPSTSIFNQTLGGSANTPGGVVKGILGQAAQTVTPAITTPAELYFGKRVLGGGDVPVESKGGSYLPYLFSKTPLTNTAFNKGPGDNGLASILSFLSGLGISVNTPGKQTGELYRQRDEIVRNRQKSGYKVPKSGKPAFYESKVTESKGYN